MFLERTSGQRGFIDCTTQNGDRAQSIAEKNKNNTHRFATLVRLAGIRELEVLNQIPAHKEDTIKNRTHWLNLMPCQV